MAWAEQKARWPADAKAPDRLPGARLGDCVRQRFELGLSDADLAQMGDRVEDVVAIAPGEPGRDRDAATGCRSVQLARIVGMLDVRDVGPGLHYRCMRQQR